MENEPSMTFNLLFYVLIMIPMMLVVYGFSKRMSGKPLVPVILTGIPIFGLIYFYYYCYKTIAYLLDATNSLEKNQAANSTSN